MPLFVRGGATACGRLGVADSVGSEEEPDRRFLGVSKFHDDVRDLRGVTRGGVRRAVHQRCHVADRRRVGLRHRWDGHRGACPVGTHATGFDHVDLCARCGPGSFAGDRVTP